MLKNPQNALAPNSRICAATLGINADYGLKAPRKATEGEGRLLAGSPSNFRRSLCAVTGIVIDRKIRVFQHNPSRPDVGGRFWQARFPHCFPSGPTKGSAFRLFRRLGGRCPRPWVAGGAGAHI